MSKKRYTPEQRRKRAEATRRWAKGVSAKVRKMEREVTRWPEIEAMMAAHMDWPVAKVLRALGIR